MKLFYFLLSFLFILILSPESFACPFSSGFYLCRLEKSNQQPHVLVVNREDEELACTLSQYRYSDSELGDLLSQISIDDSIEIKNQPIEVVSHFDGEEEVIFNFTVDSQEQTITQVLTSKSRSQNRVFICTLDQGIGELYSSQTKKRSTLHPEESNFNKVERKKRRFGLSSSREAELSIPLSGVQASILKKSKWTTDEDEKLISAVEKNREGDVIFWQKVSEEVDGRSKQQCQHRWEVTFNSKFKRGSWTAEEDMRLRELVAEYPADRSIPWVKVAERLSGRSNQQCLKRWVGTLNPKYNKGPWTEEEDAKLREIVEKYGINEKISWVKVAKEVDGRSDDQCRNRWELSLNPAFKRGPWTEEEDAKLREIVAKYPVEQSIPWVKVAKEMDGRSNQQCRKRWEANLNPKFKKGHWTAEEDANLREIIVEYPLDEKIAWAKVAKQMDGRSDDQCRDRWEKALNPMIKKGPWTAEEDEKLREIIGKYPANQDIPWVKVAEEMDGRGRHQCRQRWELSLNPKFKKGPWTAEEDAKLRQIIEKYPIDENIPWEKVSKEMDIRSHAQCRERWEMTLNPTFKNGPWTAEEDAKLRELVASYPANQNIQWVAISKEMNGRSDDQCRQRWELSLNPTFKKGSWTAEEDEKLCELVAKYPAGHKISWVKVAEEMNGRGRHQCRQRWEKTLKARKIHNHN